MIQSKANSWIQVAPVDIHLAYRLYPIISQLEKLALSFAKENIKPVHIQKNSLRRSSKKMHLHPISKIMRFTKRLSICRKILS